ncbi:BatA (Bacteroides aerotolerance operon) [hydrothermal vent metagenome]|uniref:BatA (Bacteroides aerotolerance operon) n=1 Tax=hydrothermal vent metagenome TaxID=652676 RepID=A0A1W1EFQ2_9ZZZZ
MYFTFDYKYFFILLLFIPCFWWCKQYSKTYYFSKIDWIKKQSPLLSWEPWVKIAIFSLMVIALAKPFVYDAAGNSHKKGRDLILAIDASGSMAQSGFDSKDRFKNKYESTIELAKAFTKKRLDDNMGVVVFGTFAYTASPLTYDLEALNYLLDMTNVGIAGESTAIGDALMQSMRTLSFGEAKNKVIILLTDGYHNAGNTSPKTAVAKAKEKGIKIYTIGIGKKSDYDVSMLQTIAKKSNAKSYAVDSAEGLKKVFKEIDKLEPSQIRGEHYLNQKLLILFPLSIAALLLLGWILYERRRSL